MDNNGVTITSNGSAALCGVESVDIQTFLVSYQRVLLIHTPYLLDLGPNLLGHGGSGLYKFAVNVH